MKVYALPFAALMAAIAFFAAAPQAQACELICVQTKATFSGSPSLAVGNAACAAEYPDFKYMRTGLAKFSGGTLNPSDMPSPHASIPGWYLGSDEKCLRVDANGIGKIENTCMSHPVWCCNM